MRAVLSRFALGAAAIAALAVSGCKKDAEDVAVKADGSGRFAMTETKDLSAMKAIAEQLGKEILGAPGDAPMGDAAAMEEPKKSEKEKAIEELKREWKDIDGLEITKVDAEEKDGKVTFTAEASFTSLEAYAKASAIEMGASLKKNEDGSYTLRFGDEPLPAGEAAKAAEEMAKMVTEMVVAMEPFLKDLEMTRKLTLPGTIVETNGTKGDDGASVSWKLTYADLKAGKSPEQTVTFKGDALDLKPFSIKREHKGMGGGAPK